MPSTATRLILTWPSQIKAHSSIPNNPKDANERPASDKPHPTILILQSESNLTVPPKQFSTEHIYPNNQNQQSSSSLNIKILPEIKSSNSLSLKFF